MHSLYRHTYADAAAEAGARAALQCIQLPCLSQCYKKTACSLPVSVRHSRSLPTCRTAQSHRRCEVALNRSRTHSKAQVNVTSALHTFCRVSALAAHKATSQPATLVTQPIHTALCTIPMPVPPLSSLAGGWKPHSMATTSFGLHVSSAAWPQTSVRIHFSTFSSFPRHIAPVINIGPLPGPSPGLGISRPGGGSLIWRHATAANRSSRGMRLISVLQA